MAEREHELSQWIRQTTNEMAGEYERIRSRATEDPGTAGDEGEENWADLFREWLPSSYKVRTKGRILSHNGEASRQVDVVILRPGYPERLLSKKLYIASGVAAAFECKLTVNAAHITEAHKTARQISRMAGTRTGSPYRELTSPIVYGILAHSHYWSSGQYAIQKILELDAKSRDSTELLPREHLDIVCIADTCTILKSTELKQTTRPDGMKELLCLVGNFQAYGGIPPVGSLLGYLLIRLGWEDSQVRPFAEYFRLAKILLRASGGAGNLGSTGLTEETKQRAMKELRDFLADTDKPWDWNEWGFSLE